MWLRPGYTPETPAPPREHGEKLATFARGPDAEMRVSLAEFEGRPYVSLRLWERDRGGGWWPVKGKGCSIRISEAPELSAVLARLSPQAALCEPAGPSAGLEQGWEPERRVGAPGAPPDRPRYVEKGRRSRPDWTPETLPPASGGPDFNEFE